MEVDGTGTVECTQYEVIARPLVNVNVGPGAHFTSYNEGFSSIGDGSCWLLKLFGGLCWPRGQ